MGAITKLTNNLTAELYQDEKLQKSLILQILKSKRLLIEHVETLQYLEVLYKDEEGFEVFTFWKTSGIVAASAATFFHIQNSHKYLIPAFFGMFPIFYAGKLWKSRKIRGIEKMLENCLKSLDQTDRCIKKFEMFLNELQLLKHSASFLNDKDNKFIKDSFNSVFSIIRSLFITVKFLEGYKLSEDLNSLYTEFTDFDEEAIRERLDHWQGDFKDIKDYHLLFQLIQSQFLTRFSLLVASNVHESVLVLGSQLKNLTLKLLAEKDAISKNLKMVMDPIGKLRNSPLVKFDALPKEFQRIKSHSLKFSSKIMALAIDSQLLDDTITQLVENSSPDKTEDIEKLQTALEMISLKLTECQVENKDLFIITQQILNKGQDVGKLTEEDLQNTESPKREENPITLEDAAPEQCHDILVDVGAQDEDDKSIFYLEVDPLSKQGKKQTEARYKVIVKDLMGNEKFGKQRQKYEEIEKEILKAKGIDFIPDFDNCEVKEPSESENNDSDEENLKKNKKLKKNEKKFDEVRDFLLAKEQMNLFGGAGGFRLPPRNVVNEDILE